ncbi:MAG TPA: HAMP domain-containing sensor histidine kinase [Thermoanaerobaculia bacterium]|nr:HAMP domain-containing sensor histidine kinase [Thermoanaerobaculia bacterium]
MRRSLVVVVSLIVSLAVIAFLQYRSVSETSRAQRDALRASLDERARRFAGDFDREIGRAFNCFQRPAGEGWHCWNDNALEPGIVKAVYVFERGTIKRYDAAVDDFTAVSWPEAVEAERRRPRGPVEPKNVMRIGAEVAMLVPQPPPRRREDGPPAMFDDEPPRPRGQAVGLVQFDVDAIRTRLIPKLRANDLPNVDVAVYPPDDSAHAIFRTAPFTRPDVAHPLAVWELGVVHRAGSVDAAVRSARNRNFITSGAVLLILAMSVAMLIVTTRRAQTLARQQLDFVAGISHELNTPLAAIRSAAENLADGVVRDEEQLRRYGTLIAREGRRLSTMVEKILTYAGLQSSARWRSDAVDVKEVIDRVAADSRWMLDERGGAIGVDVDVDGVSAVRGDAEALRRALQNVVENAIKYGGTPPRIDIRARQRKQNVAVSVEDNGMGFGETDLPHVFEPFYRGHHVVARAIPGSGLGLSLVRRIVEGHGGKASVSNRTGGGAVVTIELPTA